MSFFTIRNEVWLYVPNRSDRRTAATIGEILDNTSSDILHRADDVRVSLARAMPDKGVWIFRASTPGSRSGGNYEVKVKSVFTPAVLKKRPKSGFKVSDLDIAVTCSCPAWKWGGADFNAAEGGYLYQKPKSNGQAPDIRDPSREHGICKHVAAALRLAESYTIRAKPEAIGKKGK
jgi:hypothetical protein